MAKRGVSKAGWIELALDVLAKEGIQGVKIGRLADILGIARSGFYWHFENIEELHDQLLDYWAHEYTGIVMRNPRVLEGEPRDRLNLVIEMVAKYDLAGFDLAILAWGQADDRARRVFDEVYAARYEFIGSIIAEAGFTGPDLAMRTRAFITFTSWKTVLWKSTSQEEDEARTFQLDLFLS